MMFPDCRCDDYYNENFLSENDKNVINGFDYAIEMAIDSIESFESEEIAGILGESKVIHSIISSFKKAFLMRIMDESECTRNELITSFIDEMDDKEYNEIRDKYLSEHKDNDFHDTRKLYNLKNEENTTEEEHSSKNGEKDEDNKV